MSTRRVLIIDDEDDIREVAAVSLETVEGWEILTAPNGARGLEVAAAEKPDAILLDVMMPDLDGPTTFKKLRENDATAAIPVLLLTAKTQAHERQRFQQLGVNGVLFKPFDPLTLGEQIRQVLGW
jgi:DNA-binding response OmpR family regulator